MSTRVDPSGRKGVGRLPIDRRRFLAMAASLSAAAALPACGGDVSGVAGTLRVGAVGGPNDTLEIGSAMTNLPFLVSLNVCDSLVQVERGKVSLRLAERIMPDATAAAWTIRLRQGVTFHDGRPLAAADVVDSLRYLAGSPNYSSTFADLDSSASKPVDPLTVRLVLKRPRADLVEGVLALISMVFPGGKPDPVRLVGSGPFRVESFAPDRGAVLVRNDAYWDGPPQLNRIEVRNLPDVTARVNALAGGQLDYAADLTVTAARNLATGRGHRVLAFDTADSTGFVFALNSMVAPLDDVEVRRAVRQAVNREQLVSVVFGEYGVLANDLHGKDMPGYAGRIPQRTRDLEAARRTLAAKGVTELKVLAAEITPGLLDATDLFAQQLGEAGVKVSVTKADPNTFFADTAATKAAQIVATAYANRPPAAALPSLTGATSPFSFDRWSTPAYDQALLRVQTELDTGARTAALEQAQRLMWEESGLLLWGYRKALAGVREGLTGVTLLQTHPQFRGARLG